MPRQARSILHMVDRVGKLAQVGVERTQEAQESVPADAAVAVLDLRDVGGADINAARQLLLREPGSVPQCPQRSTKDHVGVIVWLISAQVHQIFTDGLSCSRLSTPNIQVGARAGRTAGRRGTESDDLPARQPSYQQSGRAASLPEQFSRASNTGGTDDDR